MEAFLKAPNAKDITVLFAHNDDVALGAIQANGRSWDQAGSRHQNRVDRWCAGSLRSDEGPKVGENFEAIVQITVY